MSTVDYLIHSSSDSEGDFDYVPPAELVEMSEGEKESSDENTKTDSKMIRKRAHASRVRKVEKKSVAETEVEVPVANKQKANDLWKNFLDEVSEVKSESTSCFGSEASSWILENNKKEVNGKIHSINSSVNIPEKSSKLVLAFAGEVVSIANDGCVEPCANTFSVCDFLSSKNSKGTETHVKEDDSSITSSCKRKGLDSVLNRIINKKQRNITTLEKTLIDWKSFKREEQIDEDIEKYNRGKGGYIERQRFLERSDMRHYEIEKSVRVSRAKKT